MFGCAIGKKTKNIFEGLGGCHIYHPKSETKKVSKRLDSMEIFLWNCM
jgi:hypothetical protein